MECVRTNHGDGTAVGCQAWIGRVFEGKRLEMKNIILK